MIKLLAGSGGQKGMVNCFFSLFSRYIVREEASIVFFFLLLLKCWTCLSVRVCASVVGKVSVACGVCVNVIVCYPPLLFSFVSLYAQA